ncbi:MAG: prepilin-type N-terminal cleavage/methylation domain-containing protein [Rhodoferax sp.]|nr:prepilin-type N-terminal cleavage/methylation domain-containing protein [Rhodoferax sp.]
MSAPGNSLRRGLSAGASGFTLLELLLVVAIIAMAGAGVGFALRDIGQTRLEREGLRLAAMLESARARSRAVGVPVYWRATDIGFSFIGLPQPVPVDGGDATSPAANAGNDIAPVMAWLTEGLSVSVDTVLTLGPEPLIGPQDIVLVHGGQRIHVRTDGLHAFSVVNDTDASP